ncbi:MAG TPA: HTH domain-containing protein, partial [Casimicrobiaceae bacterium]|nr:HTH domain-containing protein [Casimicrobiaceae bacterium]
MGFSLLRQLSDGAFHSGEDLAATVGLTRARVSQLLKQAETAGLALERVRGRGYRLLATPDFLDAAAIRSALEEFGCDVAPADAKAPLLPAANDDD